MQAEKKYLNETDALTGAAQQTFNTDPEDNTASAHATTDGAQTGTAANYGYVTMADYKLAPELGDNFGQYR